MAMIQTSLFPANTQEAEAVKLYHRDDPETSRTAARKMADNRCKHHTLILNALDICNMTGKEIAEWTGLTQEQVMRRMHELEPFKIVKTGRKRKNAMEYRKV